MVEEALASEILDLSKSDQDQEAEPGRPREPRQLRVWMGKRHQHRLLVGAPLELGDAIMYDSRRGLGFEFTTRCPKTGRSMASKGRMKPSSDPEPLEVYVRFLVLLRTCVLTFLFACCFVLCLWDAGRVRACCRRHKMGNQVELTGRCTGEWPTKRTTQGTYCT